MSVPYTLSDTSLTVVVDFTPKVIRSDHVNFARLVELVKNPKTTVEQVVPLLDIPKAIENFTKGVVSVTNGKLFYKGFEVRTSLAQLILKMVRAGEEEASQPFQRFLENAHENPDPRAAQDLYDWVAASGLPITEDGCILAWKAVQTDYKSIHSGRRGKLDHSIGNIVSEPREECDANPDRTCSTGLHFCSAPYLRNYASGGNRVIAVKINPRDVVAFPRDYDLQKGRCAQYEVVGEVSADKVNEFYPQGRPVYSGWNKAPTARTTAKSRIAVGQRWRTRGGEEVRISSITTGDPSFPVRATRGQARLLYTATGRYVGDKTTDRNDLLTLIA